MKKMTVLFTILCAGQLYGMENPQPELSAFQRLPKEVKNLIILAFAQSGNDIDEAIKNIVRFSLVNKELNKMTNVGNLQEFTVLVGILASKFPNESRQDIARAIGRQGVAQEAIVDNYLELNKNFYRMIKKELTLEGCKAFIAQGADPSYTKSMQTYTDDGWTYSIEGILEDVCIFAIYNPERLEILEYLLQKGSNPNIYVGIVTEKKTLLRFFKQDFYIKPKYDPSAGMNTANVIKILERYGAKLDI